MQSTQVPEGEHTWFVPQEVPGLSGEQIPRDAASAHDWHGPPQAPLQQIPDTQKPDAQSLATTHAPPLGFFPHDPDAQVEGARQSLSAAQASKHLVPLHW